MHWEHSASKVRMIRSVFRSCVPSKAIERRWLIQWGAVPKVFALCLKTENPQNDFQADLKLMKDLVDCWSMRLICFYGKNCHDFLKSNLLRRLNYGTHLAQKCHLRPEPNRNIVHENENRFYILILNRYAERKTRDISMADRPHKITINSWYSR